MPSFDDLLRSLRESGLVGLPFEQTPIGRATSMMGRPVLEQLSAPTTSDHPAMGFGGITRSVNAFKGMPSVDWRTDLPAVPGGRSLNSTQFPDPHTPVRGEHAGFYSDKPDVASKFASMFDGGAVYPVGIKFENPVVIDAAGKRAAWMQFEKQAKDQGTVEDFNRFKGAFDDPKVDGIIIENTADEGTIYIPRAPSQVRSRFEK
jgi:hypothetical protein